MAKNSAPQQARTARETIVAWQANAKTTNDLSRGMLYRELHMRLQGQLTLTAGNNTPALTQLGDEWALIQKIEIIANGTDTIKSISGHGLRWMNLIWSHSWPSLSSQIGNAAANPVFDSSLKLPFWLPDSIRMMDCCLDSSQLSALQIAVTWGTFTSINTDATGFTVSPTLEVYSKKSYGVTGNFSTYRYYEITLPITAANTQLQYQLPVGPIYRGITIIATSAGSEAAATGNTILNNIQLTSGTNVFCDYEAGLLNEMWTVDKESLRTVLNAGTTPAAFLVGSGFSSSLSNIGAVFHYDHVLDGYNTEAIDTIGFSEMNLILNVNYPSTPSLLIIPHTIIPVRATSTSSST